MATIPHSYELDSTPGCGGWIVVQGRMIVWPRHNRDRRAPVATEAEALEAAKQWPGSTVHRVDLVLRGPEKRYAPRS